MLEITFIRHLHTDEGADGEVVPTPVVRDLWDYIGHKTSAEEH